MNTTEKNENDAVSELVHDEELPFPCTWEGCTRAFKSAPALRVHIARAHTMPWSTTENFKGGRKKLPEYMTKAYRKRKYKEQVARYHAAGLNAQGRPYKNNPISMAMRKLPKMSKKHLDNLRKAQQIRRMREAKQKRTLFAFPVAPDPFDTNLDAVPHIKFCPHCGTNIEKYLS